jgi:uncharacterized repeat protein (TIGR03803 family)
MAFRAAVFAASLCLAVPGLTQAQDFEVLHAFSVYEDGFLPIDLVQASDGNIYGLAAASPIATNPRGFFKISPKGEVTFPFDNNLSIGGAGIIQASDGYLYLTGDPILRLALDGTFVALGGGGFSGSPQGRLAEGIDGSFYGVTRFGGDFDLGTIFRMTPSGFVTVLHSFTPLEGRKPEWGLVQAADGNFYGTTPGGDGSEPFPWGTIFRITPDGVFTTLHGFDNTTFLGAYPRGELIVGRDGHLYGSASGIFKLALDGVLTKIPGAGGNRVIQGRDGNFYPAANVLSQVTPEGVVTTLHKLNSNRTPEGDGVVSLIQGRDGHFYGTAKYGGQFMAGTVFRLRFPTACVNRALPTQEFRGGALNLGFRVMTSSPAVAGAWVFFQNQVKLLWHLAIPAIPVTVSFDIPAPGLAGVGNVGVFTYLVNEDLKVCADWKTIYATSE